MRARDNSTKSSLLLLLAAGAIALGWLSAIVMLISTEGPPTSSWLILLASSISLIASRLQRTSPGASTVLILVAATVAVAGVVAMRNP